MARQFNGTSDYLQSATAIDLSGTDQVTVSVWLWVNSYTDSNGLPVETSAQFYTNSGTLILSPDCSGPVGFFAGCRASTGYGSGTTLASRGAAGAWHHYVIEFNMGATLAVVAAYLDGVSVSLGSEGLTGSQGGGDFAANILNIGARNGGASNFFAGRIAQLAFWKGSLLSGTDAAAVYHGTPQSASIQPTYYWTIEGSASPEPATVGSVALNVHGTTQVADPTTGTYTLTGPTSGTIGVASTNFTVTPSASYTGTITITPSGGGLSTPITLTWSASSTAQTFTITPTSAGTVTLTPTNSGSLANPSALTYTANAATASSYTLTGPSSGTVNVASTNFTVTPNGVYTGTVTITPSGGGLSTAITLTWSSSSSAQTFTITPTAPGNVTLTPTNNGSLTNPSALSYTASAAPASSYTLTGPSSGTVGTASSNYTVTPNGGYTGTITITPSGGGLSTPITLTWSASSTAQTFTITPTSAGTVTLTPTNNGSLANPSALTYTANAATATSYTLTGPSSGTVNVASTNFTVTPNGVYTGTVTITPSGGGLSTAITLTWSSSSTAQTFTITPTATGNVTLTPTNSGSLSNPSALTYTSNAAAYTILPSDLWDNGYSNNVGGNYYFASTFAKLIYSTDHTTITLGVYCTFYTTFPAWSTCSIRVNGADYQTQACTANGAQTLTFTLPTGTKTVEIIGGGTSDPSGTIIGTFMVNVAFSGGTFATKQTPVAANRLVVYGDSIAVGADATVLELQGWTNLVRDVARERQPAL